MTEETKSKQLYCTIKYISASVVEFSHKIQPEKTALRLVAAEGSSFEEQCRKSVLY
jgi:hypothetical protein